MTAPSTRSEPLGHSSRLSPWSSLDPTRSYTPLNKPTHRSHPHSAPAPSAQARAPQRPSGYTKPPTHNSTLPESMDCLCLTPQLQTALGLNGSGTNLDSSSSHTTSTSTSTSASRSSGSSSISSSDSSASIKTQSALTGGFFGAGYNWVQAGLAHKPAQGYKHPSVYDEGANLRGTDMWSTRRDSITSISACSPKSSDEYHLVSMSDDLLVPPTDLDLNETQNPAYPPPANPFPEFKPRSQPSTVAAKAPALASLDPRQFTSAQIAALAAALHPSANIPPGQVQDGMSPGHPPHIAQLITLSTRLALGLAHPPANRGFRAKPSDMMDKNGRDEHNTTVFVGGLSQGVSESILHDIFAPFGSIAYVSEALGHIFLAGRARVSQAE
jgi:hypothetical protein